MMKRLSVGVLLLALGAMLATTAFAERPTGREWRGGSIDAMQNSGLPLFFRSTAGTTWVSVGQACLPADTANSDHGVDEVWCFGANAFDWPNVPPAQDTGSSHERWDHWSKFAPPIPPASKWHVTTFDPGVAGGTYNAWAGCDSIGTNPGCVDVAFWLFKKGYGDDWNYALTLAMDAEDASAGGTIEFDVKYDNECNYDYLYLEYLDTGTGNWDAVVDTAGTPAVFNAVSGNPDNQNGGTGRACGDDIYGSSDQGDLGGNNVPWYGNSAWLEDVTFPLPANAVNGIRLRWRAFSDGAWSDADGRGDTDGIGNIDNVLITFANSGNTVSDDFESGDLLSPGGTGAGTWTAGGLEGNTYDGWNVQFDPNYKNKGNTCDFSAVWMFAPKPIAGGFPGSANGFSIFLASPVIDCDGWTGAVMEYANYMCAPDVTNDFTNTHVRTFDSTIGVWGLWNDFDGFITFAGCEFWNMNETEDASPFLGPTVDSLQFGYEMLDICTPADFCWNRHGTVTWLIDNVSIGSFDGSGTVFEARNIDIFADSYSRNDPAHSPFLQNAEQGLWPTRQFADSDSLNVTITDFDGVIAAQVELVWRVSTVDPPVFGTWNSKAMNYSTPDPLSNGDGGLYRSSIGNDISEDYSPPTSDGLIWAAGSTVDYYVKVTDVLVNVSTFPTAASDPDPTYFRFEVLPFVGRTVGDLDERILIVDDYTRTFLDFENSTGFDPVGGAGFGAFSDPVRDQPEDMIERALGLMYGIADPEDNPAWDIYDVQGAGSWMQCEPRVFSQAPKLGGIGDDLGIPQYDAVIWPNGSFDAFSLADTTRIHLKTFLDAGGHLWSNGDEVARFLGTGGDDADSTVNFLAEYMGTSFANIVDDATESRVLNIAGVGGTSLDGVILGVYGECPLRRAFDRLNEAPATPEQIVTTLAVYSDGGAGDNGRAAIIKNVRLESGIPTGVCIHSGFGLGALLSDASRATLLSKTFVTDFGLWDMGYVGVINGVDAPVVTNSRFGFDLAQSSPNPFATSTQIRFSVPNRAHVSIEVYNILGQRVRTLVDESMEANSYVREWDGRADTGERVSSGIYFYKMVAGDYSATRKTVLLK